MTAAIERPTFETDAAARVVTARFILVNRTDHTWHAEGGPAIAWQIYDPESATFIREGEWAPLPHDLAPAETSAVSIAIDLPPERGHYHVYLSTVTPDDGWAFTRNEPFLLIDAHVEHAVASLVEGHVTTIRAMRRRKLRSSIAKAFTVPFTSIWRNRNLIASMTRRDVMQRYRGSAGDVLWTILHPVLLMATYFFVFGIVLESRFGADQSRTAFAFYFLAGMLPWLGMSDAIGRSPNGILENRVLVKKVVFPVEILPVTQVISALVTQAFATGVFVLALLLIRQHVPAAIVWLPLLVIPQLLFTLGLTWFLSATGVYLRDIGQMIGFFLTLWFFLTPICYPEAKLPAGAAEILTKNPVYVLVRGYRAIFLEGHAPPLAALAKLWVVAAVVFLGGHAWFYKLRRSFADVI
ncbi:MAG TPA: ABC transporter permease [Bryobacteraceae bacterium]|nr:ABC transporter permease [Bryobacteraceae bacterium]